MLSFLVIPKATCVDYMFMSMVAVMECSTTQLSEEMRMVEDRLILQTQKDQVMYIQLF
jgi:hypothetical protein